MDEYTEICNLLRKISEMKSVQNVSCHVDFYDGRCYSPLISKPSKKTTGAKK